MEALSSLQKLCIHVKVVFSFFRTSTIRLGRDSMRFTIGLENNGMDPAYSVSLKLELPSDLQLLRVHIENVGVYSYDCSEAYLGQTSESRYSRMDQVKFKGCLPQILLGPFLNTLTHL